MRSICARRIADVGRVRVKADEVEAALDPGHRVEVAQEAGPGHPVADGGDTGEDDLRARGSTLRSAVADSSTRRPYAAADCGGCQ